MAKNLIDFRTSSPEARVPMDRRGEIVNTRCGHVTANPNSRLKSNCGWRHHCVTSRLKLIHEWCYLCAPYLPNSAKYRSARAPVKWFLLWHYEKDIVLRATIWRLYWTLCWCHCFLEVSSVVDINNKFLRLFHTFGSKQTVSNMLTTSSTFATHGDAHSAHPIMVTLKGFTLHY